MFHPIQSSTPKNSRSTLTKQATTSSWQVYFLPQTDYFIFQKKRYRWVESIKCTKLVTQYWLERPQHTSPHLLTTHRKLMPFVSLRSAPAHKYKETHLLQSAYNIRHYPQIKYITSKTVLVLPSHDTSLIFPFHILPSPVHPTVFSFYIFHGFLSLSSSNNILYLWWAMALSLRPMLPRKVILCHHFEMEQYIFQIRLHAICSAEM